MRATLPTLSLALAMWTPPMPSAAQSAPREALARVALAAHARVRATVGVAPLTWSSQLASLASEWARHLCSLSSGGTAVLEHRQSPRVGENLFWQGGGDPPGVDVAVLSWEAERVHFNRSTGRCHGGECRHYTQLVWRNTTSVGCGMASCGAQHFVVCDYDPPGNWIGQRPY